MNRLAPLMSSAKGDWQTPDKILDLVRKLAPIGLDPCTSPDNPTRARLFYYRPSPMEAEKLASSPAGRLQAYLEISSLTDGLQLPWGVEKNELIYVNPPYGRSVGKWMSRCNLA